MKDLTDFNICRNINKKDVKRKRPTILHRRNSRSQTIKDWGERCVDVFEVIAQIGEGTYGQVITIFKKFQTSKHTSAPNKDGSSIF